MLNRVSPVRSARAAASISSSSVASVTIPFVAFNASIARSMDTGSPICMAEAKVVFALTGSKFSNPLTYAWYKGLALWAYKSTCLLHRLNPAHNCRCGSTFGSIWLVNLACLLPEKCPETEEWHFKWSCFQGLGACWHRTFEVRLYLSTNKAGHPVRQTKVLAHLKSLVEGIDISQIAARDDDPIWYLPVKLLANLNGCCLLTL